MGLLGFLAHIIYIVGPHEKLILYPLRVFHRISIMIAKSSLTYSLSLVGSINYNKNVTCSSGVIKVSFNNLAGFSIAIAYTTMIFPCQRP